jgi:hypothetical protein
MSERPRPPEPLRQAVVADLAPVTPLQTPARRALEVALWGVAALVLAPVLFGLRHDAPLLGVMMTWGAAALEVVAGAMVVVLALREAVPGEGIGRGRAVAAMAAGVAVQCGVALLTFMVGPSSSRALLARHPGATCLGMQSLLAVPALAITVVLVLRALPLRPPWAGALAGLGAGLIADGAWHLVCPLCNLTHLLVWHGGATALLIGAGWAGGMAWQRRRRNRIEAHLRAGR